MRPAMNRQECKAFRISERAFFIGAGIFWMGERVAISGPKPVTLAWGAFAGGSLWPGTKYRTIPNPMVINATSIAEIRIFMGLVLSANFFIVCIIAHRLPPGYANGMRKRHWPG